jgi:hypothetical protein
VAARRELTWTGVLEYLPGRFVSWASGRSLAPNSVTGISLGLASCAAAWFSGGTTGDNLRAVAALGGSYLAAWAALLLIRSSPQAADDQRADAQRADAHPAGAQRLATLVNALCAAVVCAGLAIGAEAARWTGTWELATAVIATASVGQTMRACRGRRDRMGSGAAGLALARPLLGPPGGGQVALIAVVAPVWGARITLLSLLSWAIARLCQDVAARGPASPPGHPACWPSRGQSPPAVAGLRDDGRIARWLGTLARGHLPALLPAIAGLAATGMVAVLGMGNLPGPLALTPAVVMLLAAPGSSYRHTGRLDWLVPAVLQAGQFLYLAALGFSRGVPAPLTFGLCALIALRYATLAGRGGHPQADPLGSGSGLGWEGRMLVAGFGALAGVTMFAYAALTAYLGVLICSQIMTMARGAGR